MGGRGLVSPARSEILQSVVIRGGNMSGAKEDRRGEERRGEGWEVEVGW